ncbi:MAG: M20/M25/M40 family metallo-hydrolase [Gemmatimonadetes bacterium]|nr:M20/M25/M40 family metallo-hydrolase [Gemmatimonadota bacterium]
MRSIRTVACLAVLATGVSAQQAAFACDAQQNRHCAEVRDILARPEIQRAMRFIEDDDGRAIRDLIRLTEIPAPPFGEEVRGRAWAELAREAGADSVWTDTEGNVLALRRGRTSGRTIVLSGHLDTVFPEGTDVTVEQRGDTLFAPGIGDDTRGIVAVLTVLRALEAGNVHTSADVLFVATVGEEGLGDLRGVKHLFRAGAPRIDAFISIDGSDDARIVNGGLGSRRYRVTYAGPGGHSWGAFGTANPVHALGRAIHIFDEAANRLTASGPRTSYNVGRIGGGTSVNSVAFEAWLEVDMRSESQAALMVIDSVFRASAQQALVEQNALRRRNEPLALKVELVGDRPSGETSATAPFVLRADAASRAFGLMPALQTSSTDSNVPIAMGIPAITIGGGGVGGGSHSPGEWWMNRNGPRGIQRALLILVAEAGIASRPASD